MENGLSFFFFLTLFDHFPGLIAHLLNNIQRKKIHIFVCCILILSNHVFFFFFLKQNIMCAHAGLKQPISTSHVITPTHRSISNF